MFANSYLEKNGTTALIPQKPGPAVGISVVIPCFREPEVLKTLESLHACRLPESEVEVILLINHSEIASEETKSQNLATKKEVDQWISTNPKAGLNFYATGPVGLKKKWAGAGLARKRGMDEAIRRFNLNNKPDGILVSLDADTLVEENYLVEIESWFRKNPEQIGATIAFSHQTEGLEGKHLEGIQLYEKYMDYYKNALDFTGYPYPMFTVGSAFAVKAEAYVKRGGMNRRQAGEDFYFLQNLVQIGPVGEITGTTVHPSARLSDRVPFGTGPVLHKWMTGEEDLTKTYNHKAFADLKQFFDLKHLLYKASEKDYEKQVKNLPASVKFFLYEDNFWSEISDLNKNCSSPETFQKRFFQKFNAFKILKYLNFAHGKYYQKADLATQIHQLYEIQKYKTNDHA
ncbi:MAG TPA: glycosyltransferase family 2 protein [Mariniphaga anaerophila]|uniref:Glycosyltransferase family 2 protein n=1 Tax=Mariniphaga anaerophila TaxID=1484053 RepID=A0A831LJG1_9BACT|nr:glycosyltransferase family 2 protein [Mariniphaga anaerophila]